MLGACVRVGRHWSAGWTRGGSRGRVSARVSCQSNSWQSGVTVEQFTAMPSSVRCFRLGELLRGSWGDGARPAARRRTLGCHDLCELASGSRPARLRRKRSEASEQVHGRSFGRPADSQQDPADMCKPGSSVATSKVCVRVRVPAQMQRCVGLPGVGRPAGDAFRRRAARARPQICGRAVLEGVCGRRPKARIWCVCLLLQDLLQSCSVLLILGAFFLNALSGFLRFFNLYDRIPTFF